jgi:hypothetical protein
LNFAPQLGVAWDPKKKGNTVLGAGIGLYCENVIGLPSTVESWSGWETFGMNVGPKLKVLLNTR